jgi:hypothetical protein
MIKRIITSGCSFSDYSTDFTWNNVFENYLKEKNLNITFDHRGLSSQGQQLIQKKTIHAIYKAFKEGLKPEEICVFVMWSAHNRRSWYIDNNDVVNDIIDYFANRRESKTSFQLQFGDLENKAEKFAYIGDPINKAPPNYYIPYNKEGGWYINGHKFDEVNFFKEYFMFSNQLDSIIMSLENILMLQSFCKSYNIKLYEQFILSNIWEEVESLKTHKEVAHLYNLIDKNNFVSLIGMHDYLKNIGQKYITTTLHPNAEGHKFWFDNVLLPYIHNKGLNYGQ